MKRKCGFTLLEMLVSISIIALILTIAVVSYVSVNKRSRDAKRKGDIEQIRSALEFYRADLGFYPAAGTNDTYADVGDLYEFIRTYLPTVPNDPKYPDYHYWYKATDYAQPNYYGYCVSATLETETPSSTPCSPYPSYNYSVKNP